MAQYSARLAQPGATLDPLLRLPNELFHRTAEFLTPREMLLAALVSRPWRAALLDAPILWSTISICPRKEGVLTNVAEAFEWFLQRSRGANITVQLCLVADQSGDSDADVVSFAAGGPFLGMIPQLLARELHRVRVLELVIHEWSGTPWEDILRQPAPVLERLALVISCAEDYIPLPDDLFANAAPRLHHVHLKDVVMSDHPGTALAGITSLFYDWAGNCGDELLTKICAMRNLRDLTITVLDEFDDDDDDDDDDDISARVGPQLRRLQLWGTEEARAVLKYFPPPEHVCYSGSLAHDGDEHMDPGPLVALVKAQLAARSVTVGFRAPRLTYHVESPERAAVYAVRLDGRDVVVDLTFPELVFLLGEVTLVAFNNLRLLAIPFSLFSLLDGGGLPPLQVLTLYIYPPDDFPEVETAQHMLSVTELRVVQVVQPAEWPAWDMHEKRPDPKLVETLPATTLLAFVQHKLVPAVLLRLILDGYLPGGTSEECQLLRDAVPQVDHSLFTGGWLPDDDCAQWQWHFPKESAIRTR
ncbi:hypothetical protein AURDEDRAFT_188801 [Auricularia subglabra TFB-10046 SS5]|uniref:F-box domain-containing protein n=1 Tax=Auricularia subglabra (strain TFB-10046 / SS5) TaxID=717982 RepID=J0D7Z5_AURST|nr:hypothetical protein AURDEDRAFT_188801 [Auricularia subglabra TFB-10046 SS5]